MYTQLVTLTVIALLPFSLAVRTEASERQAAGSGSLSQSDLNVLELALFLEHLEYNLYTGGFENFTEQQYAQYGFPAGFRDGVGVTAHQEGVHVATLTEVLTSNGVAPIPNCTYKFPYSNPKEFVELASMITTVGIGAFLGGALDLMDNKVLLMDAVAILSVEARHDSFLRAGLLARPNPTPFDTSLTVVWAYNLALMFIDTCPMYLSIIELPQLAVVNPSAPVDPTTSLPTTIQFNWDPSKFFVQVDPTKPLYIAFINQQMPTVFEEVTSCGNGCGTVPTPQAPMTGAVFSALTTFNSGLSETQLTGFGTLAGPTEIILS